MNTLQDYGLAAILGVMLSGTYSYSPGCADAIMRYSGRPLTPIGVNKGAALIPGPDPYVYNQYIATNFPNRYPAASNASVPNALTQYQSILSNAPDSSITICATGQLANLAALFAASPALMAAKVALIVIMGGDYLTGNEYNFYTDPANAQSFVNNYPGRMIFCGYTLGLGVKTGQAVINAAINTDPLYWAFKLFKDANPTLVPRESWDQLAMLRAIYGTQFNNISYFLDSAAGSNVVAADGSNSWSGTVKAQNYESLVASNNTFATLIDNLMTRTPALA